MRSLAVVPRPELRAGLLDDPCADGQDETALLGDGDEPARREQAVGGVVPPQQCFGPGGHHGVELHDRLVVQLELIALERSVEGVLGGHPVDGPEPDPITEQLHP